jgi:hypothetical protein
VGSAALSFITDIDEFIAVFSPDPPKQRNDMNIFIDILGIAFTFLGVGVFKSKSIRDTFSPTSVCSTQKYADCP